MSFNPNKTLKAEVVFGGGVSCTTHFGVASERLSFDIFFAILPIWECNCKSEEDAKKHLPLQAVLFYCKLPRFVLFLSHPSENYEKLLD